MRNEYQELKCFSAGNQVTVYTLIFNSLTYYIQDGGYTVCVTGDTIDSNTDVVDVYDLDCITSPSRIESLDDFKLFVSI